MDCGNEAEVQPIRVEGDTLLLGTAEIKLPERTYLVHEELTQPLPPERDCSKAGKTLVSISVKRDAKRLRLVIPALHLTRELTEFEARRPLYCRTTVLKLAKRMSVVCLTGQLYSMSFHLAVKRARGGKSSSPFINSLALTLLYVVFLLSPSPNQKQSASAWRANAAFGVLAAGGLLGLMDCFVCPGGTHLGLIGDLGTQ